ncbi:hypothetical protein Nepgr_000324 [Nepenthes gracilis]|uniref:Uncharacterized protein n=1 Tax=Nepenthes gracilis TaxID=150966 RepID=A0AAD3P1P4_NEPGR|nr:hypothetical protein Nepgr_000324 [Nepenthes gracilis]
MESAISRSAGRPRKRRRKDMECVQDNQQDSGPQPRKRAVETRAMATVGRYVLKEFEGSGVFLGKIVYSESGLYRVDYEDGDCEDMDSGELRRYLIGDEYFDDDLTERKKKLDDLTANNGEKFPSESDKGDAVTVKNEPDKGDSETLQNGLDRDRDVVSTVNEFPDGEANGSEVDDDADSSSDSCEYAQRSDMWSERQASVIPLPEWPPSSGTIGLPEEYIPHLFSVYGFLRSFSIRLFLSPFTLDDLVGCLNCTVPSSLLDAIHVALLRAVRLRLEALSSDGSELASKCISCIDWSLLDTLTWPVYLVHYLMVMGYLHGNEWKGFYVEVLEKDYCFLSVEKKLMVLQILCDDALESAEIRAEIDMREESAVGVDSDGLASTPPESGPQRVHPRYSKTFAGKVSEVMVTEMGSNTVPSALSLMGRRGSDSIKDATVIDEDSNGDECRLCGMDGTLLCCDGCPSAYHSRCIGVNKMCIPEGPWFCPECMINKFRPAAAAGTSLKGAELLGIDYNGQVFLATCNHLLVLNISVDALPFVRYYNCNDIPEVLRALYSSVHYTVLYSDICQSILRYWDIPQEEAGPSGLTHHGLGDGSRVTEFATCTSGYKDISVGGQRNCTCLYLNASICSKEEMSGGDQKLRDNCLYMGSLFKPHAYINHYVHGDFAASAAANLAVLLSEENRTSHVHASENHKKVMSANVLLQAKAFSLAAIRFFWPNTEKKLVEVPRERCGWCLNCKAPAASRKACLLNAAALNATRGAMKIISALRLEKNLEGSLYGIAMYTLYMEESLHGLIVGPFLSASYRQQWQKQVEQVSSFGEIKVLLLQLEENLRTIALSGDWVKLVDNLMNESSMTQITCPAGSTEKHGPNGRRNRKHLITSEVTADDTYEWRSDYSWWRGGKLSKLVVERGILPRAMLRKVARQGGSREICGIYYVEGSNISKRSRQLIWRAAVEMSSNASQLALQIRYLDHNIRWSDLVRPEQQDGKGPETEASAFRNASICDKKVVDNKIMYGVTFGHQRHLPSRVMKSIAEKEESQEGKKDKYWIFETRIPLYLIKEYEENAEKAVIPPLQSPLDTLSPLQRRQLKNSRRDIFSYLARKRDNMAMCFCASCHLDVLLRNAVKCSACEGYCHKGCTMSSTVQTNGDVEFIITCKLCYKGGAPGHSSVESPTSPLAMQGQEDNNVVTVSKSLKQKGNHQQPSSVGTLETSSGMMVAVPDSKSTAKQRKKLTSWGLIWRKKKTKDTGIDFRLKNILWRSNPDNMDVKDVVCHLCHKLYSSHLTYIHCETCKNWFHADAVELDESKILDLMGFKCCRCRRIRSPVCPYSESDQKKTEGKRQRVSVSKQGKVGEDNVSRAISEQTEWSIPTSPISPMEEDVFIQVDDSIIFSVSKVESIAEQADADFEWDTPVEPGPQKLPVRRHQKHENEVDGFGFTGINPYQIELYPPLESKNAAVSVPSPHAEWDVSTSGLEDGMTFDYENFYYEDAGYEPQTYFSFRELLASDDGGQPGLNGSENVFGACENWTCTNSQSGFSEHEMGTSSEDVEPLYSAEPAFDLPCKMCSHTEPAPDLSCQNCGLQIHSHCSPWEDMPQEESWRCGTCRLWR